MIADNPYYAYKHLIEAPYLGPSDREAAEILWTRLREAQKRAGRLAHEAGLSHARVRQLEERLTLLSEAQETLDPAPHQYEIEFS